jgi:hypothetical protein
VLATSIIRVMMMEAGALMTVVSTSELSVNFYQITRRNNPETAILILAAVRT